MVKPVQLHFQRFEFKYRLPLHLISAIKEDLFRNQMQLDPYVATTPGGAYPVTSLYFDNAGWGCFWDKEAGLEERAKLRFRVYSTHLTEHDTVFLELKQKHDATVSKKRIVIPRPAYDRFLETNSTSSLAPFFTDESRAIFREIRAFMERNCLYPRLLVRYRREPLVWRFNDRLRITFDHDIAAIPASSLCVSGAMFPTASQQTIMEVKYNAVLPFWFEEIVHKYELGREPFSKYGNGVLACQRFGVLPNV